MQSQDEPTSMDSALNLWQEAVEKSSVDLDKIVANSLAQLNKLSNDLEESLKGQLMKASELSSLTVEANIEDLSLHRDDIKDQLSEFERQEIDRIYATASESRMKFNQLIAEAKNEILEQFAIKIRELQESMENPKEHFTDFSNQQQPKIDEVVNTARKKIENQKSSSESSLSKKAKELEEKVEALVASLKEEINSQLTKYDSDFDQKIGQVIKQLEDLLKESNEYAQEVVNQGTDRIDQAEEIGSHFLEEHIESWTATVDALKNSFEKQIIEAKEERKGNHIKTLEYKVAEAKASINQMAESGNSNVASAHRKFFSTLKRLEKKYSDRIAKQMALLEQAIEEEKELPLSMGGQMIQADEEFRKNLDTQLKVRGNELVKSIRKQVDQLESEFKRSSSGSTERIESIRLQTVESLEKQVRIIRSELDRISKSFKSELTQLSTALPEIEERGKVAAMSVSAYLSSMLTLDSD